MGQFFREDNKMMKKILIIGLFLLVFVAALCLVYRMKNVSEPAMQAKIPAVEAHSVSDSAHFYSADDLTAGCAEKDQIFCAIERVVKCTMAPELESCDKKLVPAFVLGKAEDVVRPRQMSFEITKIKPIIESSDISVYTKSDCDALWFGLCKGTVIYSLSPREGGHWAVTNVYAIE